MHRENTINPYQSCPDRSDNGKNHRSCGKSHSAQSSRKQIHNTAHEISQCCIRQHLHGACNDIGFFGIQLQNFRSEGIYDTAKHQRNRCRKKQAMPENLSHSLPLTRTVILTCKAHAGLRHRIDRSIHKSEQIICRCIAGHRGRAKRIYRRLQKHVGEIDDRALNSGRNSHPENLSEAPSVYPKLLPFQTVNGVRPDKAAKNQNA